MFFPAKKLYFELNSESYRIELNKPDTTFSDMYSDSKSKLRGDIVKDENLKIKGSKFRIFK